MKEAEEFATEFIKENEDTFALLGLEGILTGSVKDEHSLYAQFAEYCKQHGVSREEALQALSELLGETLEIEEESK